MLRVIQAMISSTLLDLPHHRGGVRETCQRQRVIPLMMELLPASPASAVEASLDLVEKADIYIGIFGFRYGYQPPGQSLSITEMEYQRAVELEIPRLIFLMGEDHMVKVADIDCFESRKKIDALRERLKSDQVCGFFNSAEELRILVTDSLWQWRMNSQAPGGPL